MGLIGFTKTLSIELGEFGIRATQFCLVPLTTLGFKECSKDVQR